MDKDERKKTGLKKKIIRKKTAKYDSVEGGSINVAQPSASPSADMANRVRALWQNSIPSGTLPGQTLGGETFQPAASLPGGTYDSEDAHAASLPGGTYDSEDAHAASLPGGTYDSADAHAASLPGGTYDPADAHAASLTGGTYDSTNVPDVTLSGGTIERETPSENAMSSDRFADGTGASDFRIIDKIAQGGMGEVLRSNQVGLDRIVAYKRPLPTMMRSERKIVSFVREGKVTGDLEHPNIVPVYQNGVDPNGLPFYAMKLIRGVEWRFILHPELADDRCDLILLEKLAEIVDPIDVFLRTCDAVSYAHSRGVIHRDLKPENIMVGEYGEVQVMDWGLALDVSGRDINQSKAVPVSHIRGPAGTPSYMAPEMALGETDKIGIRTDVYLLGAIMYEFLTGRPPHIGNSMENVLYLAAQNQPPHPADINPSVSAGLAKIALKAMSTNPDDRYSSVPELQSAVKEHLRHAQSIRISSSARSMLNAILAESQTDNNGNESGISGRYIRYAEAVSLFRQSLELWKGNEDARLGLLEGLEAFIRSALDGGDLGLASAQLDEFKILPDALPQTVQELDEKWKRLDSSRRARQRNFKIAIGTAAALLFALIGGGLFSYSRISEESSIAKLNEKRAIEALDDAQQQRDEAQRQKVYAEQKEREAKDALAETERQKTEADSQREKAILNATIAKQNEEHANIALQEVQKQKEEVQKQKDEADRQKEIAKQNENRAVDAFADAREKERDARQNLAQVDLSKADTLISIQRDYPQSARAVVSAIRILYGEGGESEIPGDEPRRRFVNILNQSPRYDDSVVSQGVNISLCRINNGNMAVLLSDGRIMENQTQLMNAPAGFALPARMFAYFNNVWFVVDQQSVLFRNGTRFDKERPGSTRLIASAADGSRLAVMRNDGRLAVYSQTDTEPDFVLSLNMTPASRIVFISGGNQIACGFSDGKVSIVNIKSRAITTSFRAQAGPITAIASNDSGNTLATADETGAIRVWNVETLKEIASLIGHTSKVSALAFRPNQSMLASHSLDGTVRIWRYENPDSPLMATLHVLRDKYGVALTFIGGGDRLSCFDNSDSIRIWRLEGWNLMSETDLPTEPSGFHKLVETYYPSFQEETLASISN